MSGVTIPFGDPLPHHGNFMLNVFKLRLPAHQHSAVSLYTWQHKYSATSNWNWPFFFRLAFLQISVIWQPSFCTCPMDKGSIEWVVVISEEVGVHVALWWLADIICHDRVLLKVGSY